MKKLHIKKGDKVRVLSGSKEDRGRDGEVLLVNPKNYTAIVEGRRMITKHLKPDQENPQGRIVRQEAPIHLSNLMLIDPKTGEPTRTGRRKSEGKGWERYSKKSGEKV
ncbi:MAG: 50S ribosomal protein L24 [Bacteroidota bacterium]